MFLILWIGSAIATAGLAHERGRSPWLWLIIGLLTGFLGLIAVLVMERQN